MGGLNGGHYTAYGKHGDEWMEFDDSRVKPCGGSEVVTKSGYVIFYKRKGMSAGAGDGAGAGAGGDDATGQGAVVNPAAGADAGDVAAASV